MLPVNYVDYVNSNPEPSQFDGNPARSALVGEALHPTLGVCKAVWSKYLNQFTVFSPPNIPIYTRAAINVVWCDLAFTELQEIVLVWEDVSGQITIDWVSTSGRILTTIQGKSPSCALTDTSDIMLVYINHIGGIEYRLMFDEFTVIYPLLTPVNFGYTQIIGYDYPSGIIKTEQTDALLLAAGTQAIYAGTDIVGFDWGVIPWDKN